eukprot:gene9563-17311_t
MLDKALLVWFQQKIVLPNVRINGDMLLAKANQFAENFGYESAVSMAWVDRFKKRHNIKQVFKSGEAARVNQQDVDAWKKGKLKDILQRYQPENIFNADETDNCSAHPKVELSNTELAFLSPNMTSITQPIDTGIIKNLKLHYRQILAARHLGAAEADTNFKWNILDAMIAIKSSWNKVKEFTIKNCYQKCGFMQTERNLVEENDNDELSISANIWDILADTIGADSRTLFAEYVKIDKNEVGIIESLTDTEIIDFLSEEPPTKSNQMRRVMKCKHRSSRVSQCPAMH